MTDLGVVCFDGDLTTRTSIFDRLYDSINMIVRAIEVWNPQFPGLRIFFLFPYAFVMSRLMLWVYLYF